jgi:hypothetical protein
MLAAHNYYKVMILDEIDAKIATPKQRQQPHLRRQRRHQKACSRQCRPVHLRQQQQTRPGQRRAVQYTYVGNGIGIADGAARPGRARRCCCARWAIVESGYAVIVAKLLLLVMFNSYLSL